MMSTMTAETKKRPHLTAHNVGRRAWAITKLMNKLMETMMEPMMLRPTKKITVTTQPCVFKSWLIELKISNHNYNDPIQVHHKKSRMREPHDHAKALRCNTPLLSSIVSSFVNMLATFVAKSLTHLDVPPRAPCQIPSPLRLRSLPAYSPGLTPCLSKSPNAFTFLTLLGHGKPSYGSPLAKPFPQL